MADWEKKGASENVKKGPGSKGGSSGGRARGPSVSEVDGHDGRGGKGDAGASATEKTHNATFAEGGDTHMFGEQEAGSRTSADKSPSTGKPDSSGPGEKFAEGGKGKMFGFAGAVPATAGITAPRVS
jgi:hypothetical protein